jgi:hypothetical protein
MIMKRKHLAFAAVCAAALGLSAFGPALAASDYLLELDDVVGEVTTKTTIEVASWSFGASNPTSVGSSGMSSGRRQAPLAAPPPSNGQVNVVTAREAGSGMATGRCAMGKHFASATLRHGSQRWALTGVMVSSCASDGMTISYRTAVAGYDLKANKKI